MKLALVKLQYEDCMQKEEKEEEEEEEETETLRLV
jgi:hypothetical protein